MITELKEEKPEHHYILPESQWRHHLGGLYTVLHIANEHAKNPKYQPMVVYQGANGKVWAKTVPNFLRTMREVKVVNVSPWARNLTAVTGAALALAAILWMLYVMSAGLQ